MIPNTIEATLQIESATDKALREELTQLKTQGEAPDWYTLNSWKIIKGTYVFEKVVPETGNTTSETPKDMYHRVAQSAAKHLGKPELESRFFDVIWKGWLGLATPVATNLGTDRGLPISCFSSWIDDSVDSIFNTLHEVSCMTSKGGGTAVIMNEIRERGADIYGGGKSEGVVPWAKIYNEAIKRVSQGKQHCPLLA